MIQSNESVRTGSVGRAAIIAATLNSSGLSTNTICKRTGNYYSWSQDNLGFFGGSIPGFSLGRFDIGPAIHTGVLTPERARRIGHHWMRFLAGTRTSDRLKPKQEGLRSMRKTSLILLGAAAGAAL